jgi:minor capsid protein
MSAAADVITLIVTANLGTYSPTDAGTILKGSKSVIPAGAGPFITLTETGGSDVEGTHNLTTVPAYVKPTVQVVVRASSYDVAFARAQAIYNLIYPIRNRMVNGTWWREVRMLQSEPMDIGLDADNRPRLSFNFECTKRQSPATSGQP